MIKPWKVLSTVTLVVALSVSMVVPAFAVDGDITDTSSGNIYTALNYNSNTSYLNNMINQIIEEKAANQFIYEWRGEKFGFDDFSAEVTQLIAEGETPVQAKDEAAAPPAPNPMLTPR
jgi:hypothetical protein